MYLNLFFFLHLRKKNNYFRVYFELFFFVYFLKLENYIFQVKKLTDERERLTNEFKQENSELRNAVKSLEQDLLLAKQANNNKTTSDSFSEGILNKIHKEII